MSDFKLDVPMTQDREELEFSSLNGKTSSSEKINAVYKILNSIHKQGNRSIRKFATNAESRALGDR